MSAVGELIAEVLRLAEIKNEIDRFELDRLWVLARDARKAIAAQQERVEGQEGDGASTRRHEDPPIAPDEAGSRPSVDEYAQARWGDYLRRCRELQASRLQREEVVRNHGTCE